LRALSGDSDSLNVLGWPGYAFRLAACRLRRLPLLLAADPHHGEVVSVNDACQRAAREVVPKASRAVILVP
jgi:hypothetical protein